MKSRADAAGRAADVGDVAIAEGRSDVADCTAVLADLFSADDQSRRNGVRVLNQRVRAQYGPL